MRKHCFGTFAIKSVRKTYERRRIWKIRNVIYKAEIRGFRTTLRRTDRVEIQLNTCVKTALKPLLSALVMRLNVNIVFFSGVEPMKSSFPNTVNRQNDDNERFSEIIPSLPDFQKRMSRVPCKNINIKCLRIIYTKIVCIFAIRQWYFSSKRSWPRLRWVTKHYL